MTKVYIASPYTIGDTAVNVRRQIDAANELMDMGLLPFAPLMSHFHHLVHPRTYEQWMSWDLGWLASCDCVLRLGGESIGADIEVKEAIRLGKSVYYSIDEIKKALAI